MKRILIVDDSKTQSQHLKEILDRNGYVCLSAADGEQGLERAKMLKPDLILMDVVMPGMNGYQATRALHKDPDTAKIPVIVVSAKDQAFDREWALRQGAVDYLIKPVDEKILLERIRAVIGQ
jgi:twitching motility two-component system response regulator PilH